jgi:hypothetical protein
MTSLMRALERDIAVVGAVVGLQCDELNQLEPKTFCEADSLAQNLKRKTFCVQEAQ